MNRDVARPGARRKRGERWIVWSQPRLSDVEFVDEDLVQTQIAGQRKFLPRIDDDAMTMRSFLSRLVHTGSFVLNKSARLTERAVLFHRQRFYTAPAVVCDDNTAAFFIQRDVAGTITAR